MRNRQGTVSPILINVTTRIFLTLMVKIHTRSNPIYHTLTLSLLGMLQGFCGRRTILGFSVPPLFGRSVRLVDRRVCLLVCGGSIIAFLCVKRISRLSFLARQTLL